MYTKEEMETIPIIIVGVVKQLKREFQKESEKSYLIQASDLVAGTVRRLYLNNMDNSLEFSKRIEFVNYRIFLP